MHSVIIEPHPKEDVLWIQTHIAFYGIPASSICIHMVLDSLVYFIYMYVYIYKNNNIENCNILSNKNTIIPINSRNIKARYSTHHMSQQHLD